MKPDDSTESTDKPVTQLPHRAKQLDKPIGQGDSLNAKRPKDAAPVPSSLLERYGNKIEDVWWYAKGRNGPDGDPTIGINVDGLRKTFGGYVWNEWWYFQKKVHGGEDEEDTPLKCYWYRKRKVPDPNNPEEYEIVEEYVGIRLIDPDTNYDVPVPEELEHDLRDLCHE